MLFQYCFVGAWVQSEATVYGIYGGQSDNWTDFFPSTSVPPLPCHYCTMLHIHISFFCHQHHMILALTAIFFTSPVIPSYCGILGWTTLQSSGHTFTILKCQPFTSLPAIVSSVLRAGHKNMLEM